MNKIIDIVIPTWNRPEKVQRAIASAKDASEVIVVDDGSKVPAAIPAPGVLITLPAHTGLPGLVKDIGIQASTAPYVAILDDDDFIDGNGLARVNAFLLSRPDVDVLCTWHWRLIANDPETKTLGRNTNIIHLGPQMMFPLCVMARKAYDAVGGFHTGIPCGVDIHLYYRLWQQFKVYVMHDPVYVVDETGDDRLSDRLRQDRHDRFVRYSAGRLD